MAKTVRTDCLAYDKKNGGECKCLMELKCAKGNCRFYKNQDMLDAQIAKIRTRIPDYQVNPNKAM